MSDNLKDVDRLNRGKVTAQQFAQALDMSRVTLLERQVRACWEERPKSLVACFLTWRSDVVDFVSQ